MKIDGRMARNLIRSLQKGTIRPGMTKYIHRGHEKWINAQMEVLLELGEDGGAVVHFVRGSYGEGKTHFLHHIEDMGRERGWVTAHLECRRDNVELDRFETVYPRIMQKLTFPGAEQMQDGDIGDDPALQLLDHWSASLMKAIGYERTYVTKPFEAETKLYGLLDVRVMKKNLPGDLRKVLCAYPRAIIADDPSARESMVAWFRGEADKVHIPMSLLSKPGQRVSAPGVARQLVAPVSIRPITAATSLDVFRGLIWLITACGYQGLILCIDEVEHVVRLQQKRRDRCFQALREFVDNTDCEIGLRHLALYFAATPNIFDDPSYFRSYDALATRIEPVGDGTNWRAPVINLEKTSLRVEDYCEIARNIRNIYGYGYGAEYASRLNDGMLGELVNVVDKARYRIAKPRLLCRSIVDQLEKLRSSQTAEDPKTLIVKLASELTRENEG